MSQNEKSRQGEEEREKEKEKVKEFLLARKPGVTIIGLMAAGAACYAARSTMTFIVALVQCCAVAFLIGGETAVVCTINRCSTAAVPVLASSSMTHGLFFPSLSSLTQRPRRRTDCSRKRLHLEEQYRSTIRLFPTSQLCAAWRCHWELVCQKKRRRLLHEAKIFVVEGQCFVDRYWGVTSMCRHTYIRVLRVCV